jgi:hypothetical protein
VASQYLVNTASVSIELVTWILFVGAHVAMPLFASNHVHLDTSKENEWMTWCAY